ncbi:MAG: fasciclin domain-containing protein [Euzebya sp.]
MRTRSIALLLSLLAGLLFFPSAASAQDSAEICDAAGLVDAVESGPEDGTLAGMADDPVGTAAASNPVLTTLVTTASAAGLVDTLNAAESLTIFAPTDCAFAGLDPATLDAAMADPSGLLTTVLGFHVIPGERLAMADLSGDYEAFTGETITVNGDDVDGQATILVPDIMTANATVHLIDTVMLPPSVTEAAQDDASPAPTDEASPAATDEASPAATDEASPAATEGGDDAAAPTGGVATGAGGTAGSSLPLPLIAVGFLALLALGGAVVARKSS